MSPQSHARLERCLNGYPSDTHVPPSQRTESRSGGLEKRKVTPSFHRVQASKPFNPL